MPEISLFYGIRIIMNWAEHNPPHFHSGPRLAQGQPWASGHQCKH